MIDLGNEQKKLFLDKINYIFITIGQYIILIGRTGRLVTHDRNPGDKVTIAPFFD